MSILNCAFSFFACSISSLVCAPSEPKERKNLHFNANWSKGRWKNWNKMNSNKTSLSNGYCVKLIASNRPVLWMVCIEMKWQQNSKTHYLNAERWMLMPNGEWPIGDFVQCAHCTWISRWLLHTNRLVIIKCIDLFMVRHNGIRWLAGSCILNETNERTTKAKIILIVCNALADSKVNSNNGKN